MMKKIISFDYRADGDIAPPSVEAISGRPLRTNSEKPLVVFFDVHGTLIDEFWLKQAELTYQMIQSQYGGKEVSDVEARAWVRKNLSFITKDEVLSKLAGSVSHIPIAHDKEIPDKSKVDEILNEAKIKIESRQSDGRVLLKPLPGIIEFLKELHGNNVPIIVMSGESRQAIVNQLEAAGLLQYLDPLMIYGKDTMVNMMPNGVPYDRDIAIQEIYEANFPNKGYDPVHFNDWVGGQKGIRELGGTNVGIPQQGSGEVSKKNREILMEIGFVDFIQIGGYQVNELLKMLKLRRSTGNGNNSDLLLDRLKALNQKLKDNLGNVELLEQRKIVATNYLKSRLLENPQNRHRGGADEILVVAEGYINSHEYSGMQDLLLNSDWAKMTANFFCGIAELEPESLSQNLSSTFIDPLIRGSQGSVGRLTPAMKEVSRLFAKTEVNAFKDGSYKKAQDDWLKERGKTPHSKTDDRWAKPVLPNGDIDFKLEAENIKSVLAEANGLKNTLNKIIGAIILAGNLSDSVFTVQSRVKSEKSTLDKLEKLRKWGIDASVGGMTDLLGGRIIVKDLQSLEKTMLAVEEFVAKNQDDPRFQGIKILRKENKFIANDGKDDPYRAIQYTITMPGANASLYSFELQLNDFNSVLAAEFTEQVNYKELIRLMPGLNKTVAAIHWRQTEQSYRNYLVARTGVAPESAMSNEEMIELSIESRNFNAFYDLVLKAIDQTHGNTEYMEQVNKWMNKLVNKEVEYLMEFQKSDPETFEKLIKAAHDKGYWETKAVKGMVEDATSTWLKPDLFDSAGYHVDKGCNEDKESQKKTLTAFYLLTPAGQKGYINQYETFNGRNKLSIGQLDLHHICRRDDKGNDNLILLLKSVGKDTDSEGIKSLISKIELLQDIDLKHQNDSDFKRLLPGDLRSALNTYMKNNKDGFEKFGLSSLNDLSEKIRTSPQSLPVELKQMIWSEIGNVLSGTLVLNCYHAPYEELCKRGAEIKNEIAKKKWNNAIVTNQIKAVAISVLLTEIDGIDDSGVPRDLGQIVHISTDGKKKYNEREKLIHEFWLHVLLYDKNDPRYTMAYPTFVRATEINIDFNNQADIDITIDRSIMKEIGAVLLGNAQRQLQRRDISPVMVARIQHAKAIILEKFIRSNIANKTLGIELIDVIRERYARDSTDLLRDNGVADAFMNGSGLSLARTLNDPQDYMGAKLLSGDSKQAGDAIHVRESINFLIANSDLNKGDINKLRDLVNEFYPPPPLLGQNIDAGQVLSTITNP